MIQESIYTLLTTLTSPNLTKVYPVSIPQEVEYPATRYARSSSTRDTNFDEVEDFVRTVIEVDNYAESYNDALERAENTKAALNNYAGGNIQLIRLDVELDTLEESTNLYRIFQQFTVWHSET